MLDAPHHRPENADDALSPKSGRVKGHGEFEGKAFCSTQLSASATHSPMAEMGADAGQSARDSTTNVKTVAGKSPDHADAVLANESGSASGPTAEAIEDGLANLIVCPTCDALYHQTSVPMGAKGICQRCGTTLAAPRERAMTRIVMLAATSLVLMVGAVFFPFLEISAAGMQRSSSVLDAVLIFADGVTLPLTIAVGAFIIFLPSLRLALLIYALAPMALGDRPARLAIPAFRWAEALRPWAMAEIFVIGVAVALVKVAGLAKLSLGVAFWAFVLLVLVNVLNDNFMCRLTVWRTLEQRSRS